MGEGVRKQNIRFADTIQPMHNYRIEKGYILGFMRNESGVFEYGFIGQFSEEYISEIKRLNHEEYNYIQAYKSWEESGYTDKKLEWSRLKKYDEKPHISLEKAYMQLQKI